MKTEINSLMKKMDLDAIWIQGSATHNPAMTYFTGSAHISGADLILIQGQEPVIFCNMMERDEAASTGLKTVVTSKYDAPRLLEESGGNILETGAKLRKLMFEELDFTKGRVSVYGNVEIGPFLGTIEYLKELLPEIEFIGEGGDSILLEARAT